MNLNTKQIRTLSQRITDHYALSNKSKTEFQIKKVVDQDLEQMKTIVYELLLKRQKMHLANDEDIIQKGK